jgi:hypothetical protein
MPTREAFRPRGRASPGRRRVRRTRASALLALFVTVAACGKKGPPLPPLVRLPAAPANLTAERRGMAVDVQFVVPSANADGSRPANIQRVDVYAVSGPAPASENVVMQDGVLVGSVEVKSPRDPNLTIDPDEPESDLEPLEGPGLDQGGAASMRDRLTAQMLGSDTTATRTYVGVGITTRGRRGLLSKAVAISLAPAPAAPGRPAIAYDETAVTVTWPADGADLRYALYDVSPPFPTARPGAAPPAGATTRSPERRLNAELVSGNTYADPRIVWNAERCYAVRAVRQVDGLVVEGDPSPIQCATLTDTFAPPAPSGLRAVASEGAINLIWTPSTAADLAGYRVLRREAPSATLRSITPELLTDTTLTDAVRAGVRYAYAVQAVDTAGNSSEPSVGVEETAR